MANPQFNIPTPRGPFATNAAPPQVDFNPAPQANPIDSALQGLELGQSLGLRQKQMQIQEEDAQRRQQKAEAEERQAAIDNIKVKGDFYSAKWFKGMSQDDKNSFHRGFLGDLGKATGIEVDIDSDYQDNDSETAGMLVDLYKSKLGENDIRKGAASIIAESQKRGSDKEYLEQLRKTAEFGSNNRSELDYMKMSLRQTQYDDKLAEKDGYIQRNNQAVINQANRIIGKVDEALGKVSAGTAGVMSRTGLVPGTPARDLRADLLTIKANLGFAELQAMRLASPTGAALGPIALQELEALQATIASLDQEQSPAQVKTSLNQIRTHYTNWKATVEASRDASNDTGGAGAADPKNDLSGLSDAELMKMAGQ